MSKDENANKQPIPFVTRRRMVAVAGGFFLNKATPILPWAAAEVESTQKDGVGGSFFLTPRFRELIDWISINQAFDEGNPVPDFGHQFTVYGHRLLRNPPSRATILQFLSSPVFIQSAMNAEGYVVGKRSIEKTADDICQMASLTPEEMEQFIASRIEQGPQSVFGLVSPPAKSQVVSAEKPPGLRAFTDRTFVRKPGSHAAASIRRCTTPTTEHQISDEWSGQSTQQMQSSSNGTIGR